MFEMLFDPSSPFLWVLLIAVIAGAIAVISRPFSTYVKFVYPNAKFEAMGNPFINESELDKVIENKDLTGFKETLSATRDYKITGDSIKEIQKSLDDVFIENIKMMKNDSSKKMKDFYDAYLEKLDTYLIKNAIKHKLQDRSIDEKIVENAFLLKTKELLNQIISAEKKELPSVLQNYGFEDEIINLISEENIDFLKLDIAIDRFIVKNFKNVKVPYKCDQAKKKFVNTLIDTNNIKYVLRAKQLGYDPDAIKQFSLGDGQEIASWKFNEMAEIESVPQIISSLEGTSYFESLKNSIEIYHKEKSVQVLENALDSNFLKLVKNISTQNYVTMGPTLRFLVSKEYEVKNLKIIAKGIGEGLSAEFIKPLLVREVA